MMQQMNVQNLMVELQTEMGMARAVDALNLTIQRGQTFALVQIYASDYLILLLLRDIHAQKLLCLSLPALKNQHYMYNSYYVYIYCRK